jgi:acetyl esterase/lipase
MLRDCEVPPPAPLDALQECITGLRGPRPPLRWAGAVVLVVTAVCLLAGCERFREPERRTGEDERASAPIKPPAERTQTDVRYSSVHERHTLDVFLPSTGGGPFPVIVFVHGGSYVAGDKSQAEIARTHADERGYALVAINYRLLQHADFPAQIHDVKAAVRWVRANADTYAFDTARIAAWGVSAGGHLAALAGTSAGVDQLEDEALGNSKESSAVHAVVDWFGPSDFFALERFLRDRQSRREPVDPGLERLSALISESPGLVMLADPATHASADDPPFLIQHGSLDEVVPLEQSELLAERLTAVRGEDAVTLDVMRGAGHGGPPFTGDANLRRVFDFLDTALQ